MPSPITQQGPQGLKGLPSLAEARRERMRALSGATGYDLKPFSGTQSYGAGTPMGDYGSSKYDEPFLNTALTAEQIQDTRYENQPWYDVLANGVGKMLGTAATTFASSLIGLPAGLATAAAEGRWSGIWDNDVVKVLSDVDQWLEKNMTNYQSQEQQQDPHFRLGDMNWWADNVIKNAGFTLGAAASGAVGAGALGLMSKALNMVNTVSKGAKIGNQIASALFSATGEGMIEARQGVEERNKLKMQQLEDEFSPQYNALDAELAQAAQEYDLERTGVYGDPAYAKFRQKQEEIAARRQELDSRKNAAQQEIEETGRRMGNAILLGNQVLLTAGNLIQFGKALSKSYDSARHVADIAGKTGRPAFVSAVRAGETLAEGWKLTGKNLGRLVAATKGLVTEGSEEMNQQWISDASGTYYDRKDINDYWKARLEPESLKEASAGTYSLGDAISKGFKNSWGNPDQWEQFMIGAFTGMTGTVMPTKVFNQDESKSRWNPSRYFSWEGGAINELRDFNNAYDRYEENINDLNQVVSQGDFQERVQRLGAHTALQKIKEYAAGIDDKKLWKDADDKQMIHDIQAFVRAGKTDDLRAIYKDIQGTEFSDEDIDHIIGLTSEPVTKEEDKQRYDAQKDQEIAERQSAIQQLQGQLAGLEEESGRNQGNDAVLAGLEEQKRDLRVQMARYSKEIGDLTMEKEAYEGKASKGGVFLTDDGNIQGSRDRVREIIRHNAEELERKLDSYLDSVDRVIADSKGQLSKDQEDNLAYLHNLSKETVGRARKIVTGHRKNLPSLFVTDRKTAKLFRLSPINDDGKGDNVEVDTSSLSDQAFSNFFLAAVSNSKWQQGEDARQKDVNWKRISDNFHQSFVSENGENQQEENSAFEALQKDLLDAESLMADSKVYGDTLEEYMNNPEKVEKDKAAEEKRQTDEALKGRFKGKEAKDINTAIDNGEMSTDDVDSLIDILQGKSNLSTDEQNTLTAAKNSKDVRNTAENLRKSVAKAAQRKGENASEIEYAQIQQAAENALKMIDSMKNSANSVEDLDPGKFIQAIEEEKKAMETMHSDLNTPMDTDDLSREEMFDIITSALEDLQKGNSKRNDIPDSSPSEASGAEETGHDPVTKTKTVTAMPKEGSRNADAENVNSVSPSMVSTIIDSINRSLGESQAGAWRNAVTQYKRHNSAVTYHEYLKSLPEEGEGSIKYKRGKAIYDYLKFHGAFDTVENADSPALEAGKTPVHFVVRNFSQEIYGKHYGELNEEQRKYALAIIMMTDKGQVIGDLPFAEWEPSAVNGNPNSQVKMLKALQDKLFAAFDSNSEKSSANEAIVDSILHKDGADNLNMTFKNGRPLMSRVTQVMHGDVPFTRSQTYTLNEIGGDNFLLGVAVPGNEIATTAGKDDKVKGNVLKAAIGKTGTPYYLLPTSAGQYIPVPFYTKAFNLPQHRSTGLYKLLTRAIQNIVTDSSKDAYKENMDVIQALLQVKPQDDAIRTFEVSKDTVKVHLRDLLDKSRKIEITVPNTTPEEIASSIADRLSGSRINVSLQFLNRNISAGKESGEVFSYNRVIGEIADANIKRNSRHSINSWFTIALASEGGMERGKKVEYRTAEPFPVNIDGRTIMLNPVTYVAFDQKSGEPVTDERAMLTLAKVKADKENLDTPFKMQVGSEVWTYDPKQEKFTRKSDPVQVRDTQKKVKEKAAREMDDNALGEGFFSFMANPPSVQGKGVQKEADASPAETENAGTGSQAETVERQARQRKYEDIRKELEGKVITPQTKDAWNLISENLVEKMYNEGAKAVIGFKGKSVTVSFSNRIQLKKVLAEANPLATTDGLVKITEAPKTMESVHGFTREDQKAARKWLAKNLPMLDSDERVQFVEKLSYAGNDGMKVWGTYKNGVLQVLSKAPMGTTYHEAFHYVMDMLLDNRQRKQVLDAAREHYGSMSNLELEERLAEDFRRYTLDENADGIIGRIKRWFRKLRDAISRHSMIDDETVNLLFWNINHGKFAKTQESPVDYDAYTSKVSERVYRLAEEKVEWQNLARDTRDSLIEAGLDDVKYSNMSLAEKEQWLKCRT